MQKKIVDYFRTIHAWGGAVLSILFILISLTGSLLVWKPNYLWLTIPEAQVEFLPTPESLALIAAKIESQLIDDNLLAIQFATEELPLSLAIMLDEKFAYFDVNGNLLTQWQGNERIEEWIYDLHHRLLLKDLGLNTVGVSAMLMTALLLAGIVAFWPRRKGFRQGFWPRDSQRLQLLKSHRNIGIIVALPFLLSLVTGIVLVYPAQTEELLLDSVRSTEEYSMAMVEGVDSISGGKTGEWLPAMQRALEVFPNATIRSAQVPGKFSYYRIIGLQQDQEWNRTGVSRVYIDAYEGYMDIRMDAVTMPLIERAFNAVTPLHTGKLNQWWYKILLTLSGLCIMIISGFGLVSFIKSFARKGAL